VTEAEVVDAVVAAFAEVFELTPEEHRLVELPGYSSCC
jgi:hypothetical protein